MTMQEMRAAVEKTIATRIPKDRFSVDEDMNVSLSGKYTVTELTFISLVFAHYKTYATIAKFDVPSTHKV